MADSPHQISEFLAGKRIAVAGVSRSGDVAANAVFRKLKASGYEAYPVNPNADEVEGVRCYKQIGDVPGPLDGVVIGTHPGVSEGVVQECAAAGVKRVWLHRSFGQGSVSQEAMDACREHGLDCLVGGCPLMFLPPVDFGHRCMRWWLQRRGRIPR